MHTGLKINIEYNGVTAGSADFIYKYAENKKEAGLLFKNLDVSNSLELKKGDATTVSISYNESVLFRIEYIVRENVHFNSGPNLFFKTNLRQPQWNNFDQQTLTILYLWSKGKSVNWRKLKSAHRKSYIRACLKHSGLSSRFNCGNTVSFDFNTIHTEADFYCMAGEFFVGDKGYFGQDMDGFRDCFSEVFMSCTKNGDIYKRPYVIFEKGLQIRNSPGHPLHDLLELAIVVLDNERLEVR